MGRSLFVAVAVLMIVMPAGMLSAGVPATPLLPDLFAWESAPLGYMHLGTFDTTTLPGRALYRFTAAIPNIGDGPFEVFEVTHPNDTQDVYQNIYDTQGGVTQTLMGSFPDADPAFGHLFLVGLALSSHKPQLWRFVVSCYSFLCLAKKGRSSLSSGSALHRMFGN